ncbi:hypothetical protein MNNICLKF_00101 [Synechococcus sp. CBW1107]|nr:hypothetical protein MNNICLKF_00101 [Synechococcus sp. CBW1107]
MPISGTPDSLLVFSSQWERMIRCPLRTLRIPAGAWPSGDWQGLRPSTGCGLRFKPIRATKPLQRSPCGGACDRLEQIHQRLQFLLWLPQQHNDQIRPQCCGLSQLYSNGSMELLRQFQCQSRDRVIHRHLRKAAQPLHRRPTSRVLQREALQQLTALRGMHEEPSGAAFSAPLPRKARALNQIQAMTL